MCVCFNRIAAFEGRYLKTFSELALGVWFSTWCTLVLIASSHRVWPWYTFLECRQIICFQRDRHRSLGFEMCGQFSVDPSPEVWNYSLLTYELDCLLEWPPTEYSVNCCCSIDWLLPIFIINLLSGRNSLHVWDSPEHDFCHCNHTIWDSFIPGAWVDVSINKLGRAVYTELQLLVQMLGMLALLAS